MTPDQVAADIQQMLDGLTGELRARKAARLADPNTSAIWRALYAEKPKRKRKPSMTRTLTQAAKAGVTVSGATVGPDGTISITIDKPGTSNDTDHNEWDTVR